jgi:hypothetical protein
MFNFILNTTAISGLDLLHLQIHTNMVANPIGIAYSGYYFMMKVYPGRETPTTKPQESIPH